MADNRFMDCCIDFLFINFKIAYIQNHFTLKLEICEIQFDIQDLCDFFICYLILYGNGNPLDLCQAKDYDICKLIMFHEQSID